MAQSSTTMSEPLELLGRWLEDAETAGIPAPRAMTLATATADGRPSARLVSLKRVAGDALIFTTALWTRKVEELRENPRVAATFYWPAVGRQARIEGAAEVAERGLAEELFSGRPRGHQLQAHISRQGAEIESIEALREQLAALDADVGDRPVACPEDWGAVRIVPERIEFWEEAADRLHRRTLYKAEAGVWRRSLLAP
jgi:pyridoxamine 5'-phosphate oxidase